MCEILALDPEQTEITVAQQVAYTFNEEQGDGLGVLAVHDDGEQFSYETYKSTDPHWKTLYGFLRNNWDAFRVVIHGRAATAGEVNRQNAHPLRVDCRKCDFDYVVHNGSVRSHDRHRRKLSDAGHEINTQVDSEIIAHKVSEIPETIEDHNRSTYRFHGNLNYLLFGSDGIFIRVSAKYALDDDMTMTCRADELDGFDDDSSTEWMVVEPGGETKTKERSNDSSSIWVNSKYRSGNGKMTSGTKSARTSANTTKSGSRGASGSTETSDSDTYTIEYRDLLPDFDRMTCVMVGPNTLKIIDRERGESQFINRNEEPKVFYYYSPEETPEEVLDDAGSGEDKVEEATQEITQDLIANISEEENVSMKKAASIAESMKEELV